MQILSTFTFILLLGNIVFSQQILFSQNVDDNWDIYWLNGKNGSAKRLTDDPKRDFQSDYSFGNNQIVFDSYRDKNGRNIFVLDVKTHAVRQLTFLETRDGHPVWSSDGKKIAFQSSRSGDPEVFIMKKDGSAIQQITNSPGYDGIPVWSPGDEKLAFNTSRHGSPDVYIYDLKKKTELRMTTDTSSDFVQSWSSAGLLILSNRSGTNQLYRLDPETGSMKKLATLYEVTYARYDKKGTKIVYTAKTKKGINIFTMNTDGSGINQLTNTDSEKRFPIFANIEK